MSVAHKSPQTGQVKITSFKVLRKHRESKDEVLRFRVDSRQKQYWLEAIDKLHVEFSSAVLCPITSRAKGYPFEVQLPSSAAVHGVVLSDHLKNLDWKGRKAVFKGKAPASALQDVTDKISALLVIE
jgi:hypothetical protein